MGQRDFAMGAGVFYGDGLVLGAAKQDDRFSQHVRRLRCSADVFAAPRHIPTVAHEAFGAFQIVLHHRFHLSSALAMLVVVLPVSRPIAAARLFHELAPDQLRGRVIVLPALNAPAVEAATRCSPIDGVNLNRAFADPPLETPTGAIASWLGFVLN